MKRSAVLASALYLALALGMTEVALRASRSVTDSAKRLERITQAIQRDDWQLRGAGERYAFAHAQRERTRSEHATWVSTHPITSDIKSAEEVEASIRLTMDPKYQVLNEQAFRSGLPLTYGALYRKLGLTPSQQKAFEDVEVEFKAREDDIQAAINGETQERGETPAGDAARAQLLAQNDKDEAAAEAEVLGNDKAAAVRAFDDAQPYRASAQQVAWELSSGGEPLSASQVEQLAALLRTSENPNSDPTTGKNLPGWTAGNTTHWEAIQQGAAAFLSQGQLSSLEAATEHGRYRDLQRQMVVKALVWEREHPVQPDGH